MEQKINLNFPKDLTKLAGNSFGRTTYVEQVKDIINIDNTIVFIFPERIDRIASSFIQGFFDELFCQLGVKGIEEKINFESSIKDLKQFILDNLE